MTDIQRASSGWSDLAGAGPALGLLEHDETVECVVIGAGFTGLALARRLAELRPETRVALVEAGEIGAGASGRTSGILAEQYDVSEKTPHRLNPIIPDRREKANYYKKTLISRDREHPFCYHGTCLVRGAGEDADRPITDKKAVLQSWPRESYLW